MVVFILWFSQTDGSTGFLRAARAGNLEKVLEHLANNTDINVSNAVSRSLFLYYAGVN
jgi:hypothetical protein